MILYLNASSALGATGLIAKQELEVNVPAFARRTGRFFSLAELATK